jgi:4-hydroxybenzoate polyprenyltransferase
MGLCRVLVYVTVALAAAGVVGEALLLGAAALLAHLVGLTYAAKQENLKQLSGVWPLAVLALPPMYGIWLGIAEPLALPFVGALGAWLIYSLTFLLSPTKRSIPAAVVRLIAGIALVDAVLLAATGAVYVAACAAACCALTRLFQRYVPGT